MTLPKPDSAKVIVSPTARKTRATPWITRLTLVASGLISTFGFFAVSSILPQIEASFASDANAALLTSLIPGVTSVAFAASSPFAGWLIDRWGYRLVYLLSLLLFAVAGLSTGALPSLEWILATRVVTGVAIAGVLNAGSVGISILPGEERAGLFGIQAFLGGAAGILLSPLTGLLAHQLGWRWVFSVYAIAVPFALLCLRLPDMRSLKGVEANRVSVFNAMPKKLLLLGAFMGTVMFLGTAAMPFAIRGIGIGDAALVSVPLTAMSIVSLFGSGGYGRLHRRIGTRTIFAIALAIIGVGLIMAGLAASIVALTIANGILGLGLGTLMPNLNAAGAVACKNAEGRALGLIAAAIYGIQALVPFAFWPIGRTIGFAGVFMAVGCLALVLAGGFLSFARMREWWSEGAAGSTKGRRDLGTRL
jgi:MFS family permease